MLNDYKVKLLTVFTEAFNEIDDLENKDDRIALVNWLAGFTEENLKGLAAYASMDSDTRNDVRKGLINRLNSVKKMLKEGTK